MSAGWRPPFPLFLSVVMVVDGWLDQMPGIVAAVTERVCDMVGDYEIILVDNASGHTHPYDDLTRASGLPNVQILHLLQPVTFETAAWAGVENSLGDFVVVFDPFNDTLDPLERGLRAAVDGGRDIVLMVNRAPRLSGRFEAVLRWIYGALVRRLFHVDLQVDAAQYRLMSKRVVSFLLRQPFPATLYRILPITAGFRRATIEYHAGRRADPGRGLRTDLIRATRLLVGNSVAPVRLASTVSLVAAAVNGLYSVYIVITAVVKKDVQPGWTTLSLQQSGMFFLFSLLAFVMTEYLLDVLTQRRRSAPYFIVDEASSAVFTRHERLNIAEHEILVAGRSVRERPAWTEG